MEVRVQDEWWAMGLRGDTRVGLEWRFFFRRGKTRGEESILLSSVED